MKAAAILSCVFCCIQLASAKDDVEIVAGRNVKTNCRAPVKLGDEVLTVLSNRLFRGRTHHECSGLDSDEFHAP